jgi:flagellar motility protein MotE (MotC chaperone)
MKQFMPVMRLMSLLFFCVATFVLSLGALLMKEGRLFPKKNGEAREAAAAPKGETGANGVGAAGASPSTGDGETVHASIDGGSPAGKAVDPAARDKALATGRALFDVAQPISISEASDLMVELTRTKQAFEERRAALDLREKELNQFSSELEQKRSAILKLAGDAQSSTAGANPGGKPEVLDKKTLTQIGNIFSRMQPQAAAHALSSYPADRAAQILINMKDQSVAEILSFVSAADLVKLTDAIGRVKGSSEEE